MTSIQELKVVRVFRALNTMIQLCHDRGYVIRHPSAIAEAVQNPALYDPEEGLDYRWFLQHFVITPDRASSVRAARDGSTGDKKHHKSKEERNEAEADNLTEEAEMLRRAANGEWICMRNAMRMSCSVDPARTGRTPVQNVKKVLRSSTASVVKEEDDGVTPVAAAKAAKNALMVFFSGEPKLTMKEVQACREKAMKKKASSMIIVANKAEPGVRTDVQELSGRMDEATGEALLTIQVFEEEALAFNVVRHETVPHHVAFSEAEAEEFLATHKLNISQLPRMLESDPLVQYLGLQRGSIVHITREGKQSGPYSMYRHVI
ncbi:putative DNA-directed RNA polymerase II [Leptomonas seymouri]|uniref:Putative DNA-directed RNA polymerase II n=1 Tax=Leptomonas seymouri TaxID=5684 RepID=A0A0N0P8I4_LEPSE|nr:putative DNA-directed RNA polymerase II [Leptomonas seymouri]|eukprot:KPI89979.1 putative DNA-directed RNA polymerase II [Leptomonas seymouri]